MSKIDGRVRSVERKLFESYQCGNGCKLGFQDVEDLLQLNAIRIRITNAAAIEAGMDEAPGYDGFQEGETWLQFKTRLKEDYER